MRSSPLRKKLIFYIFASIGIHFFIAAVVSLKDLTPTKITRPVEITYLAPPETKAAKEENKAEKNRQEKALERQIVEQDERQLNDELDTSSRFLSRYNQKVVKQTVAATRDEFRNLDRETRGVAEKKVTQGIDFKAISPSFDIKKVVEKRQLEEAEFEAKRPDADRKPAVKGSASLDYIKEVDAGLETLLSTQEFKFYNYYARVRSQLNQHWSDDIKSRINKLYKTGRWIASNEDRVTKLLVTLNQSGHLVKVQIIGDSGLRDLDEAAVEAFKKAAPFLNPPKDMVDSEGTIKLRWDFVLEA